jgi:hypothetical protein
MEHVVFRGACLHTSPRSLCIEYYVRILIAHGKYSTILVIRKGETRNAYRILVGKPKGKRPLGRPRRRLVDNIKIHLREVGWDGMDWIDLAQDRDQLRALVNTVMNLRVP